VREGEPRGEAMRELGALLKRTASPPSSRPDSRRRLRGRRESVAAVELVLELGCEACVAFMTFMTVTQAACAAGVSWERHVVPEEPALLHSGELLRSVEMYGGVGGSMSRFC
jgi:hypothetical protein